LRRAPPGISRLQGSRPGNEASCPGRGAAFFTRLRRSGTHRRRPHMCPGSAAHHDARAACCAASGARTA
jgi:hypothetical protein